MLSASHDRFSELFGLPFKLSDEVPIKVSPEGLSLHVKDEAMVRMAFFQATPSAFDSFVYTGADTGEIYGLNMEKINDFIDKTKKIKESSTVEMTLPDDKNRVVLKCGRVKVAFALLNVSVMKTKHMNDMSPLYNNEKRNDYRAVCTMRGKDFKVFAAAAGELAALAGVDAVDIKVVNGKVVAISKGQVDEAEIIMGDALPWTGLIQTSRMVMDETTKTNKRVWDDVPEPVTREPEGACTNFSLNLIEEVCNALPAKDVTFKFGTDIPLVATYSDEDMNVLAIIAPRIE